MERARYDVNDVAADRAYVQAYIGFVVYAHHLYAGIAGGGEHREGEAGTTPEASGMSGRRSPSLPHSRGLS